MADSPPALEKPNASSPCPCGSGRLFAQCCSPIIAGAEQAETAERLMRARFTAHVTHDWAFLQRTYLGTAAEPLPDGEGQTPVAWTRLVVHAHEPGNRPDVAFVDFSAYYVDQGREFALQEKAEFKRRDGAWIYTRPVREGPAPIKATHPKPGRNDPCPCGSGKKYKHCCLGRT
jgi:SEC-C motif-containing protein